MATSRTVTYGALLTTTFENTDKVAHDIITESMPGLYWLSKKSRVKAGGGDQAHLGAAVARQFPRLGVGADDACDRVHVGDGKGGHPHFGGAQDHLLGVGGPGEEGEVGQRGEFDEGQAGDSGLA